MTLQERWITSWKSRLKEREKRSFRNKAKQVATGFKIEARSGRRQSGKRPRIIVGPTAGLEPTHPQSYDPVSQNYHQPRFMEARVPTPLNHGRIREILPPVIQPAQHRPMYANAAAKVRIVPSIMQRRQSTVTPLPDPLANSPESFVPFQDSWLLPSEDEPCEYGSLPANQHELPDNFAFALDISRQSDLAAASHSSFYRSCPFQQTENIDHREQWLFPSDGIASSPYPTESATTAPPQKGHNAETILSKLFSKTRCAHRMDETKSHIRSNLLPIADSISEQGTVPIDISVDGPKKKHASSHLKATEFDFFGPSTASVPSSISSIESREETQSEHGLYPTERSSNESVVKKLRFFNDGVEVNINGCPLSRSGSCNVAEEAPGEITRDILIGDRNRSQCELEDLQAHQKEIWDSFFSW